MTKAGEDDDIEAMLARERSAMVRLFAGSLAHALGTPLQVISGHASLIADGLDEEATKRSANLIGKKARQMTELVQCALAFARRAPRVREHVDLGERARAALDQATGPSGSIDAKQIDSVRAMTDADAFTQSVHALVSAGAAEATSEVSVRLEATRASPPAREPIAREGTFGVLTVSCPGWHGFDVEGANPREPWLPPAQGDPVRTLALALACGLARENGGWVTISSQEAMVDLQLYWPVEDPGGG